MMFDFCYNWGKFISNEKKYQLQKVIWLMINTGLDIVMNMFQELKS